MDGGVATDAGETLTADRAVGGLCMIAMPTDACDDEDPPSEYRFVRSKCADASRGGGGGENAESIDAKKSIVLLRDGTPLSGLPESCCSLTS